MCNMTSTRLCRNVNMLMMHFFSNLSVAFSSLSHNSSMICESSCARASPRLDPCGLLPLSPKFPRQGTIHHLPISMLSENPYPLHLLIRAPCATQL